MNDRIHFMYWAAIFLLSFSTTLFPIRGSAIVDMCPLPKRPPEHLLLPDKQFSMLAPKPPSDPSKLPPLCRIFEGRTSKILLDFAAILGTHETCRVLESIWKTSSEFSHGPCAPKKWHWPSRIDKTRPTGQIRGTHKGWLRLGLQWSVWLSVQGPCECKG